MMIWLGLVILLAGLALGMWTVSGIADTGLDAERVDLWEQISLVAATLLMLSGASISILASLWYWIEEFFK